MYNFLEPHRVDDALLEAAYSGLPAQTKGWIKKTMALAQTLYSGAYPGAGLFARQCCSRESAGLSLRVCSAPAERCLVLFPAAYPAAARAVAAVVPALFAGLAEIYAVAVLPAVPGDVKQFRYAPEFAHAAESRYPHSALNFNLLGAWELAGVENVYCLPAQELDGLLQKSAESGGSVRVIVLGCPEWAGKPAGPARNPDFRVWNEPRLPLLAVQEGLQDCLKIVRNMHPDLKVKVMLEPAADTVAAIGSRDFCGQAVQAQLCLGEAYAGCWAWPQLEPGFFLAGSISAE